MFTVASLPVAILGRLCRWVGFGLGLIIVSNLNLWGCGVDVGLGCDNYLLRPHRLQNCLLSGTELWVIA